MSIKKLKYFFDVLLYYLYLKQTHPGKPIHYCTVTIPFSLETRQKINQLIEKSGAKDIGELLGYAIGTFDMIITTELNGGKVKIISENGVDSEDLDLLERLNKKDDWWKNE